MCGSGNEVAAMLCSHSTVIQFVVYVVWVFFVFFYITKNELHSLNVQIINPSELDKQLARPALPLYGMRHPQFSAND